MSGTTEMVKIFDTKADAERALSNAMLKWAKQPEPILSR